MSEFLLSFERWVNVKKKPTEIIDILVAFDEKSLPTINILLKTGWLLHNQTRNTHLTEFALTLLHCQLRFTTDEVFDPMAKKNKLIYTIDIS